MKHVHKIVGRTRKGRPVFAIAGGSGEPAPEPSTLTVEDDGPAPPVGENKGEEPPATPAPTSAVDPGAFNRGFVEQQSQGKEGTPPAGRTFTESDIEHARQQEKDKLYGQIEELKSELQTFREEREAEQRAREEEEARIVAEAESKAEEEMDVRELIRKKEEEWTRQMNDIRAESERAQALLEKERQFSALQEYKRAQLEVHADAIMPHLRDLVEGDTEEEIDAAIARATEKTNAILSDVAAAQQQQQQQIPTARVTSPGDGGPLDAGGGTRSFTAEDIAAMSPSEFAKHREKLHQAAARQGPYGG